MLNGKLKWGAPRLMTALMVGVTLATAAGGASAGEAEIRKTLETMYPSVKVSSVRATDLKGIFEVVAGQEVVYSDESGRYLFFGPMVDAQRKLNLTEITKDKISAVNFKDLPLELAVKTVKGDGSRVFVSFEDPNCGYCKKLHDGLKQVDNYTMYTFLLPILSADSKAKANGIWCSVDRAKALADWMAMGVVPQGSTCETPTDKVLALAQRLGVKGTPTLFYQNGKREPGYIPAQQLELGLQRNRPIDVAQAGSAKGG